MTRKLVQHFDDWRQAARKLVQAGVAPRDVDFVAANDAQPSLFADEDERWPTGVQTPHFAVPRRFLETARSVACHRDPHRYDLLYRVLWRLARGETNLLEIATDDDVHRLTQWDKSVIAAHKTKAFVRFRKFTVDGVEQFAAWHRPEHRVLPLVAPFFSRRFKSMRWTILTPDESVSWDLQHLTFGPGVPASAAPTGDALEELWKTYYGAIFNPARIKLDMMRREMPVRHWRTLPETQIIPDLLEAAPTRVARMLQHASTAPRSAASYLPVERDLAALSAAALHCQGCDLHARATQTVFGRGPSQARIMLVGEQPGDQEDLAGEPFIGPAGRVLDAALAEARLPREAVYITNAVKHFSWKPVGKKRLHQKPSMIQVSACRPWLDAEFAAVAPAVLVCLGQTAAHAVLGRDAKRLRPRGEIFASSWCRQTLITWHPAAILRAPTEADRDRMQAELAAHLAAALAAQ